MVYKKIGILENDWLVYVTQMLSIKHSGYLLFVLLLARRLRLLFARFRPLPGRPFLLDFEDCPWPNRRLCASKSFTHRLKVLSKFRSRR